MGGLPAAHDVQVSTTILGRRMAPFLPFLIPNRVPHGFAQDPSTNLVLPAAHYVQLVGHHAEHARGGGARVCRPRHVYGCAAAGAWYALHRLGAMSCLHTPICICFVECFNSMSCAHEPFVRMGRLCFLWCTHGARGSSSDTMRCTPRLLLLRSLLPARRSRAHPLGSRPASNRRCLSTHDTIRAQVASFFVAVRATVRGPHFLSKHEAF